MKTLYLYNVVAKFDDCEIETKTNDVDIACGEFYRYYRDCRWVHIMDATTGEILADWAVGEKLDTNPEWRYILTGWALTHLV